MGSVEDAHQFKLNSNFFMGGGADCPAANFSSVIRRSDYRL
jgi:hypothetical protein